jgi:hypothetical protein
MRLVRAQTAESTPTLRPQPAARAACRLGVAASLLCILAVPGRAQRPVVIQRDNEAFLTEPGGVRLGRLAAGTRLQATGSRSGHTQVTLAGWIWRESVRPQVRDGHTLAVSASGEENVRDEPNGAIVARLVSGALLDEVERRGGWVHVRRTGWMASAGLRGTSPAARPAPAVAAPPVRPPPAQAQPAPETASAAVQNLDPSLAVARRRIELFRAPGAAPAGTIEAEMPVRVTARAGEWVRVETQGWVRESELRPAGGAALNNVTAAELRADPERFRGRLVRWTIQFIALQTADELRPDFQPGERYILARGPAPEYAFAYVAVPPEKLAEVGRIEPLASVTIIARVRSGRSAFLANPILELVDIAP